ncbi:protein-tyrosine sulfotransferase-like isoform X2 [Canna indica]|uniref:Protein-tyrosine sulfotransferase-like isoform X2 n=1 Tax=Canna indica TaxID=4628 RepID=A0AAQ3JVE3_9LILI|nr:protein-tyrosine sulfotransferase-like isoform X2 [Canna indica]
MACVYRYGILVICLSIGLIPLLVSSSNDDYFHCERVVRNWADYSTESQTKEDDLTLKDILFFLHIPRTGGRTYFHCFLRKLYTNYEDCPRSYDKLRFDPSKPNCRLVTTHDDYSLMSKLPKGRTSVVTILRDPIDRVFSTYEFSIEVAARFLVHPNLTSVIEMSRRLRRKSRAVSTLDIWPWKYLVPWMRQDLFARRDARELRRLQIIEENSNPYDMEDMAMPLHEFINDPIAHELVHNGATFQVAGLTNNSYMLESHSVRDCVRKHPELGHFVLEVAKHRLNHMLYVGLTEEHKRSAKMFTNLVGAQVLSQLETVNSDFEQATSNNTEPSSSFSDPEPNESNQVEDSSNHTSNSNGSSPHLELARENMTVDKLMEKYEKCISNLRKSQATRRTMSLQKIAPVNFSRHARLSVPISILQQIQNLNSLDIELYKHAQNIFMQQQKHLIQNADLMAEMELQKAACGSFHGCSPWKFLVIIPLLMIVVLFILFVRRRTNKVKKIG